MSGSSTAELQPVGRQRGALRGPCRAPENDPEQATQLQPDFDGALHEQCNEYSECSSFQPYLRAGKPVLNAEYNLSTSQFCAADNRAGIMGALYNVNLDGSTYQPCWTGSPGFGSPGSHRGASWRIAIATGALTDVRGATAVRLSCPRGQSYCDGTVEIDALDQPRSVCPRPSALPHQQWSRSHA